MSQSPKQVYQSPRFSVVQQIVGGSGGERVQREWIEHPGAVTIVPLLDGDRVCLICNRRVAVATTLIELPAGTIDLGESPVDTARRELAEETGYHANSLEKIHEFYMSPGVMDERMHLFLATELTSGEAAREPGEEIENLIVPWGEAVAMAKDGRIQDAKTLVGLLLCNTQWNDE